MRDLGLFVPSRQRPYNIARLWESMQATCTAQTSLVVGLDEDDPMSEVYPAGPGYMIRPDTRYVTAWVNAMAAGLAGDYRVIGTVGDDNTFATDGWDAAIVRALGDHKFAFGNDLYPGRAPGTLSCHIFMRRNVYDTLGYFGPPEISHMYVDVAWYAWGRATSIAYLNDVLIPHHHYTTGAQHDDTYARSYARTGADLAAWHAYSRRQGEGSLNGDIRKLGGRPYTPEALAQFNRDLNIPEVWPW